MALFNVFGSKPKEEKVESSLPDEKLSENGAEQGTPTIENNEEEKKPQVITIKWGTGMPIDVIFNFIHKNFEEDGFQDALVNQDITYRDAKEKIIRNDLEMLFKRIVLRYKNDMRRVDVKIQQARQALALAAASDLEALRETYEEHLNEIREMQELLEANDPKLLTMIESYRRGFLKGIAATSVSFIDNK